MDHEGFSVKKRTEYPIFNNGVDSLEHGIRMYRDEKYPNAHKYAILAVYQAVELFLKDALYRINPVLIYSDIDKKVQADSHTVGFKVAAGRLENLGFVLEENARRGIELLRKRRNDIEHREYIPADDDKQCMAGAINILYGFVTQYIKPGDLSEYMDDELWAELKEYILDYETLLEDAEKKVDELTTCPPGDEVPTVSECPHCGNETLVIGGKDGVDYCFFCRRAVPMTPCSLCGEYYPEKMLEEVFKCPTCLAALANRD